MGDLPHDGLDVVPGEIVLGERIDLAVIVLLHGRGHFVGELRTAQEIAPILGAETEKVGVHHGGVVAGVPVAHLDGQEGFSVIFAGVHVGTEGGELVDKLFAQGGLEVIAIDHVLQPVGGGKVGGLFAAWCALFVGAAEGGKNVAGDFFFRYVYIDQRDLHVGGALGMTEGVFNELNAGVVFVQLLQKNFAAVGVGVAYGLSVQQADDLAAALHEGEGVQKVFVAAVERRIHDAEVVLLEAAEGEKIVVDHVQPLAAQ